MDTFNIIVILIGLVAMTLWLILPFAHKKTHDYMASKEHEYTPQKPDDNVKLQKEVGKLVRKSIEKRRNITRQLYLRRVYEPYNLPKDYHWRYFLTFETFKGYKSFTVSSRDYHKYKEDSYGYIKFYNSRFHSFEIRKREDLGIDEHIKKHK